VWLKWLRVIAYLCMAIAGVMLLLSPVLTEVYETTAEVMAWFLFIGGTVATAGSYREEWWGEFIGLPLLGSSFAVFGVISWYGTQAAYPYLAWANLLLLLGVGLAMGARWRDARNTYRIAVFASKHREEDEDEGGPL
jgi:cytosine/uracil/thiamine/allantoin permease